MDASCHASASIERFRPGVFQNVETPARSVGGVNQPFFVDDHMVHLNGVGWIFGRGGWDKKADLLNLWRSIRNGHIHQPVNANATIEKGSYERVLQLRRCGAGKVGMEIVRSKSPASGAQVAGILRKWSRPNDERVYLVADIDQPDQFRSVTAFFHDCFVGDRRQAAGEDWLHGMSPGRIRRRKLEPAHKLWREPLAVTRPEVRQSGDIQNHLASIHVADVSPVGRVREYLDRVGTISVINPMPYGKAARQAIICLLRPG